MTEQFQMVYGDRFVPINGEIVEWNLPVPAFVCDSPAKAELMPLPRFRVVDMDTGFKLSGIYPTKEEAIQDARNKIEKAGMVQYGEQKARIIARHGRVPGRSVDTE